MAWAHRSLRKASAPIPSCVVNPENAAPNGSDRKRAQSVSCTAEKWNGACTQLPSSHTCPVTHPDGLVPPPDHTDRPLPLTSYYAASTHAHHVPQDRGAGR